MFDVGFWEMAFIGVIALVVIGPERLPGVARTAGLWVGKGRRMLNEVMSDVKKEMKEYDDEYGMQQVKALRDDLKAASESVGEELADITQSAGEAAALKEAGDAVRKSVDDVSESPSPDGDKKTAAKKTAKKTATKKLPAKKDATKNGDEKHGGGERYYIYENEVHKKAVIHVAACRFCNDGQGIHGVTVRRRDQWHGPFSDLETARRRQKTMTGKAHRECGHCKP